MKRECATAVLHVSQPKHKVPLLSWIQVLISDCKYAEGVSNSILFQSTVDVRSIQLEVFAVLSCCNPMSGHKILWYRLFHDKFSISLFFFDLFDFLVLLAFLDS